MAGVTVTILRGDDPSQALTTAAGSLNIGEMAVVYQDDTPFDEVMTQYEKLGLALQEYATSQGLA